MLWWNHPMESTELDDEGHMIWTPEENAEGISAVADSRRSAASGARSPKPGNSSRTFVWWDMDSCPFPAMAEQRDWNNTAQIMVQKLMSGDIAKESSVTLIGYGNVDVPDPLFAAIRMYGINMHRRILPLCMVPGAESSVAIMSMIVDLLFWALNNAPPAQMRIICTSEDKNFLKLIRGLYRRSYDVVITTNFSEYNNVILREPQTPWFMGISKPCLTYKDGAAHVTLKEGYKTATSKSRGPGVQVAEFASMGDVRSWLEAFVASDKCLFGQNISGMASALEASLKKKLDLKFLGFSSLTKLLASCADIVQLTPTSKSCIHIFPAKLNCGQAIRPHELTADVHVLLDELLPNKDSMFPLHHVKPAFKARFKYDLEHAAVGYAKLRHFLESMPTLVRLQHSPIQLNELVIQRPPRYLKNKRR